MAGHNELAPRVAAVGAGEFYLSEGPQWFSRLAKEAAETGAIVVNVRGIAADRCPVLVSLADFERLCGVGR